MSKKNEDKVLEELRRIFKSTGCLYEDEIEDLSREYDLSVKQILFVVSKLELNKIEVKNGERPLTEEKNDKKVWLVMERIKKYNKENELFANRTGNEVKEMFFDDFKAGRCHASYIPVLLLCFFQNADETGRVNLDELAESFADYYKNRKMKGLVVEKNNSILQNDIFPSMMDIKRLLLFNPLGRSFLLKYFNVYEEKGIVEMNSNMWASMKAADVSRVLTKCRDILVQYYLKS